jgi:hypothetical protein
MKIRTLTQLDTSIADLIDAQQCLDNNDRGNNLIDILVARTIGKLQLIRARAKDPK